MISRFFIKASCLFLLSIFWGDFGYTINLASHSTTKIYNDTQRYSSNCFEVEKLEEIKSNLSILINSLKFDHGSAELLPGQEKKFKMIQERIKELKSLSRHTNKSPKLKLTGHTSYIMPKTFIQLINANSPRLYEILNNNPDLMAMTSKFKKKLMMIS